jgi:hypothetical protein
LARLFPLLLILAAFVAFVVLRNRASGRGDDRVYRPRAGRGGAPAGGGSWVVSRPELDGVRDAYSSAAIDPARALARCGQCQATYHDSSVSALNAENGGRCVLCGSADLRPVRVV